MPQRRFPARREGLALAVDYAQCDFACDPPRLAFVDSRLMGVPFRGYGRCLDGAGGFEPMPRPARCGGYERGGDGILRPTASQAVWHLPEGDLVCFGGEAPEASCG